MARALTKAQADDLMERMASEFAAMFARIEQDLLEQMSRDFARGYHSKDMSALRHMEVARLRQKTQIAMYDLMNSAPEVVARMVRVASEQGALQGLTQLAKMGWIGDGQALVQSPAVLAITSELNLAVQNAARAILPSLDDFIRRAVGENVPDVLLGIGVQKQAQAKIWQKAVRQGITGVTDASGRRWNLATYVEMASRTATRRAFTDSSVYQMGIHGVELFTPVIGRDSCKSCAYWAGKILTKGNRTGSIYMPHATDETREVRVKVDATVDEARSQGWQHPNCRCQLVAYIPGLSVVADSPGYNPEREGQRAKLRELERKVRAAKVDELAAVTPEQKARAKARVRDAQAAIRQHVEEADIPRRRDREQLNLGHKDKPPRSRPMPPRNPNPDPAPAPKRAVITDRDLYREDIDVPKAKTTPAAPPAPRVRATPPPKTAAPRAKAPAPRAKAVTPKAKPPVSPVAAPKAAAPTKPRATPASAKGLGKPKSGDWYESRGDYVKTKTKTPDKLIQQVVPRGPEMEWASPRQNKGVVNPKADMHGTGPYNVNCTRVAAAMEMRARGYDVRAGAAPRGAAKDKTFYDSANNWRDSSGKVRPFSTVPGNDFSRVAGFQDAPEGSRFMVRGDWENGGAHIWNGEKINGRMVFREGQHSLAAPEAYAGRLKRGTIKFLRVDDLTPHDDMIKRGWLEWDE